MSIIGPRPVAKDQIDLFRFGKYDEAKKVKPGISGPAALYDYIYGDQFEEANVDEYMKKVYPTRRELEYVYVKKEGFLFDTWIFFETAWCVILSIFDKENTRLGFSDHVAPDETMMTLAAAYMLGAEVIEKHFTLDKTLPGNDHYHAGEPEDFKKAIANFKWIDTVLGSNEKTVLDCEIIPRREARRSLVLTRNMKAGEVITATDLMPKRPGTGISPEFVEIVLGRKVVRELEEDTILTWDMI